MFCYDKVGGQASANLFSLVMTAHANGVEPFEYLSEVFEQLPTATTVEAIEALLPWSLKPILDSRRKRQEAASQIPAPCSSSDRQTPLTEGSLTPPFQMTWLPEWTPPVRG